MVEKIEAPWTQDQVHSLNTFQRSGWMHPFTCPQRHVYTWQLGVGVSELSDKALEVIDELLRERHGADTSLRQGHVLLVATEDGWVCPHDLCGYTQNWAYQEILDWTWKLKWDALKERFDAAREEQDDDEDH